MSRRSAYRTPAATAASRLTTRYKLRDVGKAGDLRNNTPADGRTISEGLNALGELTRILNARERRKGR